jgi:hypothetical protein
MKQARTWIKRPQKCINGTKLYLLIRLAPGYCIRSEYNNSPSHRGVLYRDLRVRDRSELKFICKYLLADILPSCPLGKDDCLVRRYIHVQSQKRPSSYVQ